MRHDRELEICSFITLLNLKAIIKTQVYKLVPVNLVLFLRHGKPVYLRKHRK